MRVLVAGTAVVITICGLFLVRPVVIANIDAKTCDLLTGWIDRGATSGRVAIVEIDENSLSQIGRWPWPRDVLGRLVRRVLDAGAATVVVDMVLPEGDAAGAALSQTGDQAGDQAFADTLAGAPVVLGYAFRFDSGGGDDASCEFQPLPITVVGPAEFWPTSFFRASGMLCSAKPVSRAAAANGFLNAAPDSDGRLRRLPLVMEYGDRQYPSLALATLHLNWNAGALQLNLASRDASRLRIGDRTIALEDHSLLRLRFRGPRRTFPYISAASLWNNQTAPDALRGKIVIIGGSAIGLPNPVSTPVDTQFPDVEVEATAIDNLLQGDFFTRPAGVAYWELALGLLTGIASTLLLTRVPYGWSAAMVAGMLGLTWAGCAFLLSRTGVLLSPLPVTATLLCNFPLVTLLNYLIEKKRAERAEGQLTKAQEYSREVQRESESRYRRLIENVNDAIIMDDVEGKLVFANRRFCEWFGLEQKSIQGVVWTDYAAPECREVLREYHARRIRGESAPNQFEFEGVRPDGSRIEIEGLVTNVEEDGRIAGTQAALRDVTERKRLEAQYLQAQKTESIGKLAGIVAHDFNNMLTVINGYCNLLLSGSPDQDEYTNCLTEIGRAGERAAELTRNLLTFSRKQAVQRKALDLNSVVAEAEAMFRRLVGEDVALTTSLSTDLDKVIADSGQLNQVLMNLLVNARDAMPRGGTVVIETKNIRVDDDFVRSHPCLEPGSYVYLGVTDTGTGISDEIKPHLFEPFFTTKEPGKGTGLGLTIIYGIVQQNGGQIEVTSALGQGATFHIYLPSVQARESEPTGEPMPVIATQASETVLVVEDQDAVRRYVSVVLEDAGYRVIQAASGAEAIGISEQFQGVIHLVVTDLVLPVMNGRELADQLKVTRPEIPVLFMSGYSEELIGTRGIIAADLAYLAKPFGPDQLKARVRETLANSGPPDLTGKVQRKTAG